MNSRLKTIAVLAGIAGLFPGHGLLAQTQSSQELYSNFYHLYTELPDSCKQLEDLTDLTDAQRYLFAFIQKGGDQLAKEYGLPRELERARSSMANLMSDVKSNCFSGKSLVVYREQYNPNAPATPRAYSAPPKLADSHSSLWDPGQVPEYAGGSNSQETAQLQAALDQNRQHQRRLEGVINELRIENRNLLAQLSQPQGSSTEVMDLRREVNRLQNDLAQFKSGDEAMSKRYWEINEELNRQIQQNTEYRARLSYLETTANSPGLNGQWQSFNQVEGETLRIAFGVSAYSMHVEMHVDGSVIVMDLAPVQDRTLQGNLKIVGGSEEIVLPMIFYPQ